MKRATYYYLIKERTDKYEEIRQQISRIFKDHKERYGYRRVWLALRATGETISRKVVARLMREMGLHARQRRVHYRSYKGVIGKIAPNILERQFAANEPNQKWGTDVSQIEIKGEKCYLSPIIDMWNGEVISYTISDSPNLKMVTRMLQRACRRNHRVKNLILHSDQGCHYTSLSYQQLLKELEIQQSMSRRGNCWDNAPQESFFGHMKDELHLKECLDYEDLINEIDDYMDYYNNYRYQWNLGKRSPVKYIIYLLEDGNPLLHKKEANHESSQLASI